jgi:hypothetical protein
MSFCNRIAHPAASAVFALPLLLSCGVSPDGGGNDSAQSLTVSPENTHRSLEQLDFRAVALAWVDDTTVAVIDRDDQHVVLLGLPGGSRRRGGGRGGGPGELEGAFMLLGDRRGEVLVGDMKSRRVSHFDSGLTFVRSARTPGMLMQLLSWDRDRVTALWMEFVMTDDGKMSPEPTVGEIDLSSGDAREFYSLFDPRTGLNRPGTDNPFAPPFVSAVETESRTVLAGQSLEYRIVALDSTGALRTSFGRPELEPDYLTREEKTEEHARRANASARRGPPPQEMTRALDDALDEPQPHFGPNAFVLDSAGRLWVVTNRQHEGATEVDVFDLDGAFLDTLTFRDAVTALAFSGSRIAVLVTRTAPEIEGVQGIDLYRLRE